MRGRLIRWNISVQNIYLKVLQIFILMRLSTMATRTTIKSVWSCRCECNQSLFVRTCLIVWPDTRTKHVKINRNKKTQKAGTLTKKKKKRLRRNVWKKKQKKNNTLQKRKKMKKTTNKTRLKTMVKM